jgi:hypothetical protein
MDKKPITVKSRASQKPQPKKVAILRINFDQYLMSVDDALTVTRLMANAVILKQDYLSHNFQSRWNEGEGFEINFTLINPSQVGLKEQP